MTKYLIPFLLLFVGVIANCQELGQIVIGVGGISMNTDEATDNLTNVASFINRELSKGGLAYSESDVSQFLVHTTITYGYEKDIDISGIPLKAAEVEFDFDIKDKRGEVSFGHFSTSIPESGENTKILIRNASKQLRKCSKDFQGFLADAKQRIFTYYEQNCERFMREVQRDIAQENFDMAILLAGQVPSEVSCYQQAGDLLLDAYQKKLDRNCDILVNECLILIEKNALDAAFEKALLIPQNSRCAAKVEAILDQISYRACDQFILQAEAFYARNDFEKAVDCLAGLETVNKDCSERKITLERKMKAALDVAARQRWEFKMQQYNDQKAERKARFDQEVSMQNLEMTMAEKRQDARLEMDKVQMSYTHTERMKQMDKDAEIRAKELEIAPELEKYRSRRDVEISKNQRAVESMRIKETASVYRALFSN